MIKILLNIGLLLGLDYPNTCWIKNRVALRIGVFSKNTQNDIQITFKLKRPLGGDFWDDIQIHHQNKTAIDFYESKEKFINS